MRIWSAAAMLLLATAFPANAASVTVSDTSAALPGLAQMTTAIQVDNGLALHNAGGGKFTVTAKKFHCDQRSNGALDASAVKGGLPALACRINSKNLRDTHAGQHFGDGHALNDILGKVSSALAAVQFGDCALGGYCGVFAKSITCTIDTAIDNFSNGGRWSCAFVDGQ